MNIIRNHYDVLVKYSKPRLSSFRNDFWFMQYMNYDYGNPIDVQPSLGIHFESFHLFSIFIF